MNHIAAAVLPLKSQAVERAEKDAIALIDRVVKALEEAGWDCNVAAPFPRDVWHRDYKAAKAKNSLFHSLTTYVQPTRSMRDPDLRKRSPEVEARFIEQAKEIAAAQYDLFVGKLVGKIGAVKSAELRGSHVWGYSVLTVETEAGETQRWQTQQIVNVSVHGKLFNQWPSRKLGPKAKAKV